MTPDDVVRTFWDRIAARDWPAVAALLAPDVVLTYPHTGERFVGRENVVAINAEFPDGWSIEVQRVVCDGGVVVSEVRVPQPGVGVFGAVTWWRVDDGLVTVADEYWVMLGGEEPPAWRRRYAA